MKKLVKTSLLALVSVIVTVGSVEILEARTERQKTRGVARRTARRVERRHERREDRKAEKAQKATQEAAPAAPSDPIPTTGNSAEGN